MLDDFFVWRAPVRGRFRTQALSQAYLPGLATHWRYADRRSSQIQVLAFCGPPLQASRWTHNVPGENRCHAYDQSSLENQESHSKRISQSSLNYVNVWYMKMRPMWAHLVNVRQGQALGCRPILWQISILVCVESIWHTTNCDDHYHSLPSASKVNGCPYIIHGVCTQNDRMLVACWKSCRNFFTFRSSEIYFRVSGWFFLRSEQILHNIK